VIYAKDLMAKQQDDPFCSSVRAKNYLPSGFTLVDKLLLYKSTPVLPASMLNETFECIALIAHICSLWFPPHTSTNPKATLVSGHASFHLSTSSPLSIFDKQARPRCAFGHINLLTQDRSIRPFDTVAVDSYGAIPTSVSGNNYIMAQQCLFCLYSNLFPYLISKLQLSFMLCASACFPNMVYQDSTLG
jgi:hypothetical protein